MKNNDQILQDTIARIEGAYAPSTILAYKADCINFIKFCEDKNVEAFPSSPLVISEYIKMLCNTEKSASSIRRAVSGIATINMLNEYENPIQHSEVKITIKRMYRQKGRYIHQAQGITRDILDEMITSLDNSLRGLRDKALLLIAYDTLARRSELVTLRVEDIDNQLINRKDQIWSTVILLRKSKTDQEAKGKWLPISHEAATALQNWISAANLNGGLIFRGIKPSNHLTEQLNIDQIAKIYKRIAIQANIEKALVKNISGHSMRVGAAQDLLISGASLPIMMNKGRWCKPDTVIRYVEKVGIPI